MSVIAAWVVSLNDRATAVVPGFDAAVEAVDLTGVAGLDQLLGRHAATHAAGTVDDELLTVVVGTALGSRPSGIRVEPSIRAI